jgi:hypothetical protein
MYFTENLELNKHNPKKMWDLLREATTGHKQNCNITQINNGNLTLTDPVDIAEKFNDFFSTAGNNISNSIPHSATDPLSYINFANPPPNLEFHNIGPSQVVDIIKQFDNKTSPDLDGLSIALLKKVSLQISSPLAHIFNLSIQCGIFPEKLKVTRTVPIFKSGDPMSCDNYRPISLVKSISKVLEKIISIHLVNHLELNKLIHPHQFGFQRGKSTEHNLLHIINHVGNALNDGKYCIGVFLDLKKAFDVCNHNILLKKWKNTALWGWSWNGLKVISRDDHKLLTSMVSTPVLVT